jgi:hypothetical protein
MWTDALGFQLPVIVFGPRRQRKQPSEQQLFPRLAALLQKHAFVLGVQIVLVPVVPARVLGDELVLVIDHQPLRVHPQDQPPGSIL